jgi:hypothetical protein
MILTSGETALTAAWDDTELFRYVYRPDDPQLESPRPYFHPVKTLSGDLVSLYRPHDHVWHRGIALSLPNVGEHNFWGGVTFRAGKYVQLHNDGSMVHESFDLAAVKDDTIRIDERLSWATEITKETPITERRRVAAAAWPEADAWCLAFETTLTNVSGQDIVIGSPTTQGRPNAGYGGLFWRGPRSFTGGTVLTPEGPGGDEVMGRRGPWLGLAGQHDGTGRWSTVVFRDDDRNFAHPTQWFVRSTPFACICPAPFFDTEHVFAASTSLTLRYDIAVADGALDAAGCAGLATRAASHDPLS